MRRWDRLLDSYVEEYRARGVSLESVAYTEARLNRWGRWLKGRRPRIGIEHIDAEMITRYDSFGNTTNTSGSLTNFFRFTGREFDTETGIYFLRARYLDPTTGRFLSEDPTGFNGGVNFYSYALNRPTQWVDPMGLSAQDVGRILGACKTCTQHLTDEGFRSPGSGRLNGWWNDLTWWFKKKRQSCYGQAQMAQPCLANPTQPYDDPWTFTVVPVEWGTHRVVMGTDPNPNDPLVFCDPWMNRSWTQPKPPTGPTGGGGGW